MRQPNPRMTAASLAGAVDLSALRSTPPAAAPAGGGPAAAPTPAPTGNSPHVIDVTEATFQNDILQRSLQTPVVIDFWAEWCQPCKQLSPVLEKLAAEADGAWVLAKIDIDANPRLAQAFRVQSIPFVLAIVNGQPVDAFAGVQPEANLRQWLAAIVNAAGGEAQVPADPRLLDADDKLQAGDLDGAEAAYKALLAEVPNDQNASSGLAQIGLMRRLEGITDGRAVLAAADAAPDDLDAQTQAADVEFVSGLAEQAFARLIKLVRRTSGDDRNRVRTHLLDLFAIAPPDDPVVNKARRDLTSALF
ncbi:thioredoxin [Cryptosporangium aurantiacum]|uniref:Thioredoxin n=1 Tax=Cryptosporangium aurantiacum TaxID=134849 RepID=A0A1M7HDA9_9ACTN|nr:thioredoxin [Cryptosporangium aurantiacum]SHM26455.1 thioredoxin [Cryptosporangium aurantiacum]